MMVLLYGMSQRMSEVQEHPLAGIELVVFYDYALNIYTTLYD